MSVFQGLKIVTCGCNEAHDDRSKDKEQKQSLINKSTTIDHITLTILDIRIQGLKTYRDNQRN